MSTDQILDAIPHRPPMLLVDEVVDLSDEQIICRKTFRDDEFFFQGHYPEFPIVPGVILCEAGMQAGAVLLARITGERNGRVPVATRLNNAKFRRMVRPGDQIEIEVRLIRRLSAAFFLDAKIQCQEKTAATFEFACMLAEAK